MPEGYRHHQGRHNSEGDYSNDSGDINHVFETIRRVANSKKDQDVELPLVVAQSGTPSCRCDLRLRGIDLSRCTSDAPMFSSPRHLKEERRERKRGKENERGEITGRGERER